MPYTNILANLANNSNRSYEIDQNSAFSYYLGHRYSKVEYTGR